MISYVFQSPRPAVLGAACLFSVGSHVAAAQEAPPADGITRCETEAELVAVVHDAEQPARSFAMVSYGPGPNNLVTVGSRVAGQPIIAITPRALWLRGQETACWLPLSHDPPRRKVPPKRKSKRRRARKR